MVPTRRRVLRIGIQKGTEAGQGRLAICGVTGQGEQGARQKSFDLQT